MNKEQSYMVYQNFFHLNKYFTKTVTYLETIKKDNLLIDELKNYKSG